MMYDMSYMTKVTFIQVTQIYSQQSMTDRHTNTWHCLYGRFDSQKNELKSLLMPTDKYTKELKFNFFIQLVWNIIDDLLEEEKLAG